MIGRLKERLRAFRPQRVDQAFERVLMNQGRLWADRCPDRHARQLSDHEFRVFSQWGEDGIIQFLIREVAVANRTFIEFGVEDFSEANCRFLLMNDNWSGLVIDGDPANVAAIRDSYYFWRYDLQAQAAFITADNVDQLLRDSGFDGDLGLLSVDVDGVDYWLLDAIHSYRPRILITEYNGLFGGDRAITVPYLAAFQRSRAHHSMTYYGASLGAFRHWAEVHGYTFVGTTSIGSNAFFVRDDVMTERLAALAGTATFVPLQVREGRDLDGGLSLKRGDARLEALRGLPMINVRTGAAETL